MAYAKIDALLGKTLTRVERSDEHIDFWTDEGRHYAMSHSQDCCESVTIESIVGDLADLIGSPILRAEEATSREDPDDVVAENISRDDSFTWTFYKLATIKGAVDIRWFGSSNGYYSEEVDFYDCAA